MPLPLFMLAMLLAPAAVVNPDSLPAQGSQQAILQVDRPGMYHLSAKSGEGTSCQVVDHLRGPFASSGQSGKESCELDLLLDAGSYKLRLQSPKAGRGKITLKVVSFEEVNKPVLDLPEGRSLQQPLHPGQQASFWIRVDQRRYAVLRVVGRTAGECRLWRGGEWVEDLSARKNVVIPKEGQPLWEWRLSGMLEAGDYLLVAYGASPEKWAKGPEEDLLFAANGFEKAPAERLANFRLPFFGQASFEVEKSQVAAVLSMNEPPATTASLSLESLPNRDGSEGSANGAQCTIAPKALIPVCAAFSWSKVRQVLTVSGPPGAGGQLQWGVFAGTSLLADGYFAGGALNLPFEAPSSGKFLIGTQDAPLDMDGGPLSCQIERTTDGVQGPPLARDYLKLGRERMLDRSFNYSGSEHTIWFEVTEPAIYRISAGDELKTRCMLYRAEGPELVPVPGVDPGAKNCRFAQNLVPGDYELKIYGGREGIEKVLIAWLHAIGPTKAVTKNSCWLRGVPLAKGVSYQVRLNRIGSISTRSLVLRPLPLGLQAPLSVVVDPGEELRLPLQAGGPLAIRSAGPGSFSCAFMGGESNASREGQCSLPALSGEGELLLRNASDGPLVLSVRRPPPPVPEVPLAGYNPVPKALPKLALGKISFFDFERNQQHSMEFEVKEAGLYHVTTEGLLATECRLRTAVVSQLASDRGGGRGRNCLLPGFLRPGRYLLTVATVGESRGRAGVVVTRRPVRDGSEVAADGEDFFRAEADEVVRQRLVIGQEGKFELGTTGQGVTLQCRLEDKDGWPLLPVPGSCQLTQDLAAGAYQWTQLPITVESMRHTRVQRVREPVVLRGGRPHRIELNNTYAAELGAKGKDEFLFDLQADLDVEIQLTNGMQGRLYLVSKDKKDQVVDTVPPVEAGSGDSGSVQPEEAPPPGNEGGEAGEGEGGEGGEGEGEAAPAPARPAPPVHGLHRVHLAAGSYRLLAEHSRADVGISYRVSVGSAMLAPGLAREFAVPSVAALRLPRDGMLRLSTSGETDVRCRLFDAAGQLMLESSDYGADWNCAAATPLAGGDYQLVLEAQNNRPGTTRVVLSTPPVADAGLLKNGQVLEPGAQVWLAGVPDPSAAAVQELSFKSKRSFSCALEDDQGNMLDRQESIQRCQFLVWPKGRHLRVRLWTVLGKARVEASLASRPVVALASGSIAKGSAGRATVPKPGTYRTGSGVFCLPEAEGGLLRPCAPQVSLEAGAVIFSGLGPEAEVKLPLEEVVLDLAKPVSEHTALESRPRIVQLRSQTQALHLLRLILPPGEQTLPVCGIAGGTHELRDRGCFAASGPTTSSLVRFFATGGKPRNAELSLAAAEVPATAQDLAAGLQEVSWQGTVIRLKLPKAGSRIEITLPRDGWAVLTDDRGGAVDLCAPGDDLRFCVLSASGGELFIASDAERRARLKLILVDRPPERLKLTSLYEGVPDAPGRVHFVVAPAGEERSLEVSGALRCTTLLDDGSRLGGCELRLPPRLGAELAVEHGSGPLQAVLYPKGQALRARWGSGFPAGMAFPLPAGQSQALSGTLTDRMIVIQRPTLADIRSDSGVCALVTERGLVAVEGMGKGCTLRRLLEPGNYRLLVRPFGPLPLHGAMSWTADRVGDLVEGVGAEEWIAQGEERLFRFETRSPGEIGLGIRARADVLQCRILDEQQKVLGTGCQQFLKLPAGTFLLAVRLPSDERPVRFRPVVLGLAGSKMEVPPEYLRDFFSRIGEQP